MIANQPTYGFALFRLKVQAGKKALTQFHALRAVVARAARFSRIVHQDGEQKQVEAVNLRKQRGEALFPVVRRLPQRVNIVYDEKCVLIHRIAMVRVADDQSVNAVEFRNDQLQQAQRVHRAQRVRGMRPSRTSRRQFHRNGPSGICTANAGSASAMRSSAFWLSLYPCFAIWPKMRSTISASLTVPVLFKSSRPCSSTKSVPGTGVRRRRNCL